MMLPLEITWRDLEPDPEIEGAIRGRVQALERFGRNLMRCHVTIDVPHRRHRSGASYQVRIVLSVPNTELVVVTPDSNPEHRNARAAVRDAFDAITRELEEYERTRRGEVKRHSMPNPKGPPRPFTVG